MDKIRKILINFPISNKFNHFNQNFTNSALRKKFGKSFEFEDEYKANLEPSDDHQEQPSVVVIGAGIAGLTAASRLVEFGFQRISILEATDRPGGRIYSCWLGDMVAEMGAQAKIVYGETNPLFKLVNQEDSFEVHLHRKCSQQILNSQVIFTNGYKVDWPISIRAYNIFRQIEQEAKSCFEKESGRSQSTFQGFFSLRIQQELETFSEEQRSDAARILFSLCNTFRYQYGDDFSLLALQKCSNSQNNMEIPYLGYIGDLAPLLRSLPEQTIHYNKPVQQIRWGAASDARRNFYTPRAVVKCTDGDAFECDFVIVTVSLGVLKKYSDKLFCPALPASKTRAIENLGYGHMNKIFLEFQRPFWLGYKCSGIPVNWKQNELNEGNSWIKGISTIEQMPGSEYVICAHVIGPDALAMEQCTDAQVVEGCTQTLRKYTNDDNLPYPTTILRSKWTTDPYFCGANSCFNDESMTSHLSDLAAPLPSENEDAMPILLFAGEATCPGHHSTVQGARLSGIREAERIIQLSKRQNGPSKPSLDVAC